MEWINKKNKAIVLGAVSKKRILLRWAAKAKDLRQQNLKIHSKALSRLQFFRICFLALDFFASSHDDFFLETAIGYNNTLRGIFLYCQTNYKTEKREYYKL